MIAAVARGNFAIGQNGDLCYRIREDLMRFKEITMGHPIIMGRKTAESLEHSLSGRRNIVLSKSGKFKKKNGFECFTSLDLALESCKEEPIVFIIGGEQIYKEAYPLANTLYITEIFDTPMRADAFFPPYMGDFTCVEREYYVRNFLRFEFTKYIRDNNV